MSPRVRRVLLHVAVGLATVLAVAAGAATWTVTTQSGATWGFERLGAIFPGELHVLSLRGPIRGPLEIRRLEYKSDAMDMVVDHLTLDWRLRQLLTKKLDVVALRAENVSMRFKSHEQARRDSLARPLPDVDLPVSVIIRDALIRHIEIFTPASAEPTVLDSITLVTRALRDTLGVTHLIVKSARMDVDLRGKALPQGAYPVDLTVDWRLRQPGRSEIAGAGTLSGTLDSLVIDQRLRAPFAAQLGGRIDHLLRKPYFDGHATFSAARLREINAAWPDIVASGSVEGAGHTAAFTSRGRVRAVTPQWGTLDTDFDLAQGLDGWTVHRLDVSVPGRPTRVHVAGRMAANGGPAHLTGRWQDLTWPLKGPPGLVSPHGTMKVDGPLDRYAFTAQAEMAAPTLAAGVWDVRGVGNTRGADVQDLSTPVMGGRLGGHGRLDWQPALQWRMALAGTGLDPGMKWPSLRGRVDLVGVTEGRVGNRGPVGFARVDRLAGAIGGRPVTGGGTVQLAAGHALLQGARVQLGTAIATASGAVGGPWSLKWAVDAPNLTQALADAGGVLHAHGTITGPAGGPRIVATVRGDSLTLGDRHVRRLVADADMRLAGAGNLALTLDASGTLLGARRIDHLAVVSSGPRARHQIEVRTSAGRDSLQLALAGALGARQWRGAVRTLAFTSPSAGHWTLAKPAPLVIQRDAVALRDLCWQSAGAEVCAATFDWRHLGALHVDATLTRVPLELARLWLPPGVVAHGPVDGRVLFARSASGALAADVHLTPGPGSLAFPGEVGNDSVAFDRGLIELSTAGGQIVARTQLNFPTQGTVAANLRVPAQSGLAPAARPLGGDVKLHLKDLLLLEAIQTQIVHPHGTLDADLALGGTVAHPAMSGLLALRGGTADIPRLGLHLTEMAANLRGSRGGITLDMSTRSGPGRLDIRGHGALAAWPPAGEITVRGTTVQFMNTRDVKVQASPDLTAKLARGEASVTGEIAFPNGDVNVRRRTDALLVRPSPDVVIPGAAASADTTQPLLVHSRVRIRVGPDVKVHAFGFDVTPEGSIIAVDEPGYPTTANGTLNVKEGVFKAYGRSLTIERGKLFYAGGAITNPGVDFRATRTAKDGTIAGVMVHGTAAAPDMTVFTRPAKPQREALSYLVFGRPPQSGSKDDARILEDATNALGIGGGSLLAGRLGSAMGLNEAQLSSTGNLQESALSLGKYLSPKLYVQYGVGMFSPVNALRMRYIVNHMLTLQVESADQNRADLLYNSEK